VLASLLLLLVISSKCEINNSHAEISKGDKRLNNKKNILIIKQTTSYIEQIITNILQDPKLGFEFVRSSQTVIKLATTN
jgi:uncharacterized protein (DUF1697 family)